MKTQSRKDALARTVKMLTRHGTNVTFRGATPFVEANGETGKVLRLNLPEIPDEAPQLLVDALQGYLDHEVGHILYTPFKDVPNRRLDAQRGVFANIFEDIRLEKLLPRDLPGTRDNLERMYVNWIPLIVQPGLDDAQSRGDDHLMISALLMPMCRALGGQAVFQKLMDEKGYWAIVEPLTRRLPGFADQVQAMETYDDVLACVERLKEALTPPPPPPAPPAPPPPPEPEPAPEPESDDGEGHGDGEGTDDEEGDDDDKDCSGDRDDDGDDKSDSAGPDDAPDEDAPDGDGDDEGADDGQDGDDADDGDDATGDGDPGQDDGEDADAGPDGDEADGPDGDDAGDEPGGHSHDDDGDEQGDDADDRSDDGDADGDGDDAEDDTAAGDGGKRNRTMQEALGLLDPTLRRALYLHKRRKKSVSDIAGVMNVSEDRVEEMLREARRGLADLMRK